MKDAEPIAVFLCLIVFFLLGVVIASLSNYLTNESWRQETVARGFAQYTVDEKGWTKWQWKPTPEAVP